MQAKKVSINNFIRALELRIIGDTGENLGVMSKEEALKLAQAKGLDLVEINATSTPPIAKIVDYGKYQYEQSKKEKKVKENSHKTETKGVQIKIGTGENDLLFKAKQTSKWLKEGHRVKVDLYLEGRAKYMDDVFLKERLDRILHLVSENYKIAEPYKKAPKTLSIIIEKAK